MLIGLVGKKGSGKDTVGAYLVKGHSFERKAFADLLKKSVAELFDIPYHEIEKYKNDNSAIITLSMEDGLVRKLTFREFLQYYGTESHRDVFGEDFWVDYLLPFDGFYAGRNIVITDCRYKSEADRIRALGGFVVKIEKPTPLSAQDHHRSEVQADVGHIEYRIHNDGTIDELFTETERMLDYLAMKRAEL